MKSKILFSQLHNFSRILSETKSKILPSLEKLAESGDDMPSLPDVRNVFGGYVHAICGSGSSYGRGQIHKAICETNVGAVRSGLVNPYAKDILKRKDEAGFCPIHSACSLCLKHPQNSSLAVEILKMLINAGAEVDATDKEGSTALHWAARAGDKAVAEVLLSKGCFSGRNGDSLI